MTEGEGRRGNEMKAKQSGGQKARKQSIWHGAQLTIENHRKVRNSCEEGERRFTGEKKVERR